MASAASSQAAKTFSLRGGFQAVFATPPLLLFVAWMLPGSIAFAASSILEIEPRLHADSSDALASSDQKTATHGTDTRCDAQKASDDDDSSNQADETSAQASKNDSDDDDSANDIKKTSAQTSNDEDDEADAGDREHKEGVAASKESSDCAQKDSDSAADKGDADDDSDDNDASSSADETRPSLETRINRETDSDHNDTVTTSTIAGALVDDFFVGLRRDSVSAHDQLGSERAESTVISIHKDLSEAFGLGGGFGMVRTDSWSDFVGSFQTEAKILGADITATIARDLLLSQAAAIRARVRQTDFGLSGSYDLTKQFSSDFEFHHKLYSDHNSSNEFEWTPKYTFDIRDTKLEAGYKFNYTGFARSTDDGYWSPQRVLSHNIFAAWAFDWVETYGRLELSAGPDFVRESGKQSSGPSAGGFGASASAAFGFRPTKDMLIECYFSGDRSPGWQSTATGLSLKYFY